MEKLSTISNGTTAEPTTTSPSLYSYQARIALAFFWIFFTIMGVIGSNLIIWAVILSKKLRTVTNAFVVNLSVADFWTGLSYPWMVVAGLTHGGWPINSDIPCIIASVQFNSGLGASLFILASIALNRLVIITQSVDTYRWLYTPRKVAGMIAATWIIPCTILFLPPIVGAGALGFDPQTNTCSDIEGRPGSDAYNLIQTLGLYPIPMVLIITFYTALYIHIKRHFRDQRRRLERAGRSNPTTDVEASGELSIDTHMVTIDTVAEANRRESKRLQLAITKNLFMICCLFAVLVSPYYISLIVPSGGRFTVYGAIIATVNSCINPIVYTSSHPTFKVVLRKMIMCRYSEIPEPSDFLKNILARRNSRSNVLADP